MVFPCEAGMLYLLSAPIHPHPYVRIYLESLFSRNHSVPWRKCNKARSHWDIQGWAANPFYGKEPWKFSPFLPFAVN